MKRISDRRTSRSPGPALDRGGGATIGSVGVSTRSRPSSACFGPLPVLGAERAGALDLGVAHREAALDLDADVLAVQVCVLGEELAMDVGHLADEDREDPVVGERKLDRPAAWEARCRRFDTLANQGIGELGPGDADLELLERLELCGLEAGHERRQHPLAALDVERQRPAGVEARGERPAAVERDEAVRRLVPDEAAARGRDPDRAGGVRAERRIGEPRGRPPPPSLRSSRRRRGPGSAGSGRRRSAGSRRSSRRRTRAGSPCRRSRSRQSSSRSTAEAVRSGTCPAKIAEP